MMAAGMKFKKLFNSQSDGPTASFHNDRERPITRRYQLLQDDVQENRLDFAEKQHQLEGKVSLRKFQTCVMGRDHSDGQIEAPNATENCQCNEWNEIRKNFVEGLGTFQENNVQRQENQDVADRHLNYQESKEVELFSRRSMRTGLYLQHPLIGFAYFVICDRPNGQQQQSGGDFKVNASF